MKIREMGREQLLTLKPEQVQYLLEPATFVHIAKMFGAFWQYNYQAAKEGRVGYHALLKSGKHSDGFFVSRILLQHQNIREIMADQIVMRLLQHGLFLPNFVAGVPDGATALGDEVARMLGVSVAKMKKEEGRIVLEQTLPDRSGLLLVEDFCTMGTGFTETCVMVLEYNPTVEIVPIDPCMLSRGGLTTFMVPGVGDVKVMAVVEHRVTDWEADDCALCRMGSKAVKPKESDENWRLINEAQSAG